MRQVLRQWFTGVALAALVGGGIGYGAATFQHQDGIEHRGGADYLVKGPYELPIVETPEGLLLGDPGYASRCVRSVADDTVANTAVQAWLETDFTLTEATKHALRERNNEENHPVRRLLAPTSDPDSPTLGQYGNELYEAGKAALDKLLR